MPQPRVLLTVSGPPLSELLPADLSLVSFEGGQYPIPHQLAGEVVHVRRRGGHVVITHAAQ